MNKITFEDKVDLNNNESIAKKNKITAEDINEIKNVVNSLINEIYPIGSIYLSVANTNPSTIFGGT